MIAGIGTDLCDVRRIEAAVSRLGDRFAHRILGETEQQVYAERRQAHAQLKQDMHTARLFEILGPRYATRQGGYVRILKAGFRYGDMAPMAIIEFVDRDPSAKGAADRARVEAEDAE